MLGLRPRPATALAFPAYTCEGVRIENEEGVVSGNKSVMMTCFPAHVGLGEGPERLFARPSSLAAHEAVENGPFHSVSALFARLAVPGPISTNRSRARSSQMTQHVHAFPDSQWAFDIPSTCLPFACDDGENTTPATAESSWLDADLTADESRENDKWFNVPHEQLFSRSDKHKHQNHPSSPSAALPSAAAGTPEGDNATANASDDYHSNVDDDIKALLAAHNRKARPSAAAAVAPSFAKHGVREMILWERRTGERWADLDVAERDAANAEIDELKMTDPRFF